MSTSQQFQAAFIQIAPQFFDFFERMYSTAINTLAKQQLTTEILTELSSGDNSVRELIEYVLSQRQKAMFVTDPVALTKLWHAGRTIFQKVFERIEGNGRGHILMSMHTVLEQAAPGCTGVMSPAAWAFGSQQLQTQMTQSTAAPPDPLAELPR